MSIASKYLRRVVSDKAWDQGKINSEQKTDRLHPDNNKPIYFRIIKEVLAVHDQATYVATGWTGIDRCAVAKFELFTTDGRTYTQCTSWYIDDNSEGRIWCKTDGTGYRYGFSDNDLSVIGGTLYIWFEYTKTADAPVT